jgi:hypothetical protein
MLRDGVVSLGKRVMQNSIALRLERIPVTCDHMTLPNSPLSFPAKAGNPALRGVWGYRAAFEECFTRRPD